MTEEPVPPRERILRAAMGLLAEGGRDAVSTRAVSSAAGVQPPTIYRLFGDMRGLLDAVASHGFATYLRAKTDRVLAEDPIDDLREGWDLHVGFGVANPAVYTLMYGDPRPDSEPAAAREAAEILHRLIQRAAAEGRLRVGVERAARMIHSAGSGVTLALIATKPDDRDPEVSVQMREAVLAAITTSAPEAGAEADVASHAIALKAALPTSAAGLTAAERGLLAQWLDKIADAR